MLTAASTSAPESDLDTGGPACVIAAHGTRDPEGVAVGRALSDRVRRMLPGVRVAEGYVELVDPPIAEAVRDLVAAGTQRAVVVPLMLGTGSHVREDIPEAIAEGLADDAARALRERVSYARPLGADPRPVSYTHLDVYKRQDHHIYEFWRVGATH